MNAEVLRHGSEPMRRIEVRVAFCMRNTTPQSFVLVLEQDRAEIVQVRRLGMQQRAEDAFTHHAEDRELTVTVAAVLH